MNVLDTTSTRSTILRNRIPRGAAQWLVLAVVATACPVYVLEPSIEPGAVQGNAGVHVPEIIAAVQDVILTGARERCPNSQPTRSRAAHPLLIPTIVQWKQMRSDDPIGIFILARNSIVIRLQLANSEAPESTRTVTFMNHARLTLNQPAEHLLNSGFRSAVRALLSSDGP